jgi:hypothetical protein
MMVFVSALGNFARSLYLLREFENVKITLSEGRVGGRGSRIVVVRGTFETLANPGAILCKYVSYPTPTWRSLELLG